MKRLLLLFIATTLSASVLTGCSSKEDLQTIADLQAQLEGYSALKSECDSAQTTISDYQSQLETAIAEKEAMSAKLEALYAIEPMDETMYTIAEAKLYADIFDEALGKEAVGTLQAGQEVKVTGKSNVTGWYEIEMDGAKQMVSASLVSEENPAETQKPAKTQKQAQQPQQSQQPSGGDAQAQQPSGGGDSGETEWGSGALTDMGFGVWQPDPNKGEAPGLIKTAP